MGNEPKYTKGPWVKGRNGNVVSKFGARILVIIDREVSNEEADANQTLTSASPEMFEALARCEGYMRELQNENRPEESVGIFYDYDLERAFDALINAKAKALGAEQ